MKVRRDEGIANRIGPAVRRNPRGLRRSVGRGTHRPAIERVLQPHTEGEFEMNA